MEKLQTYLKIFVGSHCLVVMEIYHAIFGLILTYKGAVSNNKYSMSLTLLFP